jgi:hypothetical protein
MPNEFKISRWGRTRLYLAGVILAVLVLGCFSGNHGKWIGLLPLLACVAFAYFCGVISIRGGRFTYDPDQADGDISQQPQ